MISRIAVILGLCTSLTAAQAARSPNWTNSVVAVCELRYRVVRESLVVDTTVVGTATLIADAKFVYAATARHVVRGLDSVYLRFPLANGRHALAKVGGSVPYNFIFPEDTLLDLSLTLVVMPKGSDALPFDPTSFAQPGDLTPGKELRVVGFPVSVRVPDDVPFVKFGMVSAIPDTSGNYYIDSNVFPGNSGGAVIIPPGLVMDSLNVQELGRYLNPRLAGIVVGYLPYREIARSDQTGRARVEFEENSGITLIVTPQALLRFLQNRK